MQVHEVMNKQVEKIDIKDTAVEAAIMMRDGDFGALPVMDGENVVGMITDRDLTVRVIAEGLDATSVTLEDVMTADVVFCQKNDSIKSAVDLMGERQVRRLIVMDENKQICGILSLGDVSIFEETQAADALGGISEHRHDDPGQAFKSELSH